MCAGPEERCSLRMWLSSRSLWTNRKEMASEEQRLLVRSPIKTFFLIGYCQHRLHSCLVARRSYKYRFRWLISRTGKEDTYAPSAYREHTEFVNVPGMGCKCNTWMSFLKVHFNMRTLILLVIKNIQLVFYYQPAEDRQHEHFYIIYFGNKTVKHPSRKTPFFKLSKTKYFVSLSVTRISFSVRDVRKLMLFLAFKRIQWT